MLHGVFLFLYDGELNHGYIRIHFVVAIINKAWYEDTYNTKILGLTGKELIKSRILNIITTALCFGYIISIMINQIIPCAICVLVFMFIELYKAQWRSE